MFILMLVRGISNLYERCFDTRKLYSLDTELENDKIKYIYISKYIYIYTNIYHAHMYMYIKVCSLPLAK